VGTAITVISLFIQKIRFIQTDASAQSVAGLKAKSTWIEKNSASRVLEEKIGELEMQIEKLQDQVNKWRMKYEKLISKGSVASPSGSRASIFSVTCEEGDH